MKNNNDKEQYVFVYGSLKQKFHNNHVLQGATYIGKASTHQKYLMFSLGSFPALTKSPKYHITGELYRVTERTMKALDYLEGEGCFYKKEQVSIVLDTQPHDIDTSKTWVYFIMNPKRYKEDLDNHNVNLDNNSYPSNVHSGCFFSNVCIFLYWDWFLRLFIYN